MKSKTSNHTTEIDAMINRAKIIVMLGELFSNEETVHKWLDTENLNFGGSKPNTLIDSGRSHKVMAYIEAALKDF